MLQIVASLTDNSRGIIYDRNMFFVQATDNKQIVIIFKTYLFKIFCESKFSKSYEKLLLTCFVNTSPVVVK